MCYVPSIYLQTQDNIYHEIIIISHKVIYLQPHCEKCQPSEKSLKENILGIPILRNYVT